MLLLLLFVVDLGVPDLARDVVPVDVGLLEEHMQAPLVLGKGVAGDPETNNINK